MHEVEKLAQEVIVIAQGEVRAQGSLEHIVKQSGKPDFEDAFAYFAFEGGR